MLLHSTHAEPKSLKWVCSSSGGLATTIPGRHRAGMFITENFPAGRHFWVGAAGFPLTSAGTGLLLKFRRYTNVFRCLKVPKYTGTGLMICSQLVPIVEYASSDR